MITLQDRSTLIIKTFFSKKKSSVAFLHLFIANGALGQTRTGTPKRARILSPLCLPFHHEAYI